ncbi:response regulator transcription factor [Halocella sp. SP3-1]|uniref:response regulator transcription factor n=1 Tax=Halocella sp. SP3-1 TaxID=2382161 RepID=UPI000F761BDF|nr:response regulator transcription factor [Halocella sp. SP3-1]AZO93413.1 DNA-binding response regulator [Halocella sp. SP3-1]
MKIMIIEDDKAIANLLKMNLHLEGFETALFYDGKGALEQIDLIKPSLILLDIMLPDIDGFVVQSKIKKKNIPVIFLTARTDLKDKLLGLELGADDYITKPFDNRELVLRIKAVLRRVKSLEKQDEIKLATFKLMRSQHSFYIEDKKIDLTPKEYKIIKCLMENHKKVFSREELLNLVWGFDYYGDTRTIDMHIQRLRKKLGKYKKAIRTVYSVGYKLEVEK